MCHYPKGTIVSMAELIDAVNFVLKTFRSGNRVFPHRFLCKLFFMEFFFVSIKMGEKSKKIYTLVYINEFNLFFTCVDKCHSIEW